MAGRNVAAMFAARIMRGEMDFSSVPPHMMNDVSHILSRQGKGHKNGVIGFANGGVRPMTKEEADDFRKQFDGFRERFDGLREQFGLKDK